jgi:uncharacterized protein YceK
MKKIISLLAVALIASGCATLLTGTRDTISFNSTPGGAKVYMDGLELCKTPCRIPVKRSINEVDIEFKLDGFETRLFTLDKEFNVVSVINLGNLLGWAIDVATGSIMKYHIKSYELELKEKNLSILESPREIQIDTRQNLVDVYVMQE